MPATGVAQIADEIARFGPDALLITVDEAARPHTAPVVVRWAGDHLVVTEAGNRSRSNASQRAFASLVWAPTPATDGYHLIVDGPATIGDASIELVPTKAVLHQRATPERPGDPDSSCRADCVVIHTA